MSKGRLIATNIIGLIVVLAILAGGAYFYYDSISYVKTDEAHVAGEMADITAPASGKLEGWDFKEGSEVRRTKKQ